MQQCACSMRLSCLIININGTLFFSECCKNSTGTFQFALSYLSILYMFTSANFASPSHHKIGIASLHVSISPSQQSLMGQHQTSKTEALVAMASTD